MIRGISIAKLIVAEKPSVAMSYAKVLGATNCKDGYLEGNGDLVSWCVGHLVELAPPKPSFGGFGKFSPKTKKRVPLSVPREQRVNALCMEKSVLHGFW